MRSVSPRTLILTVLLGLAGWALACVDGATGPLFPPDPVTSPDHAVLVTLYEATGGDDWTQNDNWLSAVPLGEWYGVSVGADGRVVGIRLPSNNLNGSIPPAIGNLSSLEELSLALNDLSGPIPTELASLASLEGLFLHSNELSGPIPPELGSLASLEELLLATNDLSGPIPTELGNLSSLRRLVLSSNDLSGPIPPELASLSSLVQLYLSFNNLSGLIPPELVSHHVNDYCTTI